MAVLYLKIKRGENMDTQKKISNSLVWGILLIIFGLLALASQFLSGFNFWATLWPFIIVGVGLMFFVGMFAGGKSAAGLAIPGTIVTTIGLMLFIQNITGHWESWSFGWTIILTAVGLGIFIAGQYSGNESQRRSGLNVLKLGVVMFIIFGAFFGMLFNYFGLSRIVFPAVLIMLGIYLVVTRTGILPTASRENQQGEAKNDEVQP
jgi:hypothetical protein